MGKHWRYVIVDIDGCLGDYVNSFYDWLAEHGPAYPGTDIVRAIRERPYPSAEALAVSDEKWRELKDAWRASGALLSLPVLPYMQKRLHEFHELGLHIILCTTRPGEERYDVEQYTQAWLIEQQFDWDDVWFVEDKVKRLLNEFTPEDVYLVIDDDADVILNLASAGFKCEWRGRSKLLAAHRGVQQQVGIFGALDAMGVLPLEDGGNLVDAAMFARQRVFHEQMLVKYPRELNLLHLVFCTHLGQEVSELMDCFPWKFNRAQIPLSRKRLLEEAVDVMKLLINVLLLHDVNIEEFRKAFHEKSAVVEQRAREEGQHAPK